MAKIRGYQGNETEKEVAKLAGSVIDDLAKQLKEANEQIKYNEMAISFQKSEIDELKETISRLKQELKEERNTGTNINYDFHEGRGQDNEIL